MLIKVDNKGYKMTTETIQEFLASGGKISKSSDKDISLEELLTNEVLMDDKSAKDMANLVSSSI